MFMLENSNSAAVLIDGKRRLRITFVTEAIARITVTEGREFQTKPSLIVTTASRVSGFNLQETGEAFEISTSQLSLVVSKVTRAISYIDTTCKLLLTWTNGNKYWGSTRKVLRRLEQMRNGLF